MGLARAGFEVTGIDWTGQPQYPFTLLIQRVQRLSVKFLRNYDLIWASPPCQRWSHANKAHQNQHEKPDLIPLTRRLLQCASVPFVIENVPNAPLRRDITLCGSMFNLRLVRHRIFECHGFHPRQLPHPPEHHYRYVTIAGSTGGMTCRTMAGRGSIEDWCEAMGIDWMSMRALSQAVPPSYAEYLAREFLRDRLQDDHEAVQGPEEQSGSLAGPNEGCPEGLQRRRGDSSSTDGSHGEDVDCQSAATGA